MHSALYVGHVKHRRFAPKSHDFAYKLFMVYLDLAELDTVFNGSRLWSTRKPALAWFKREDYLGNPNIPVDQAVRDLVEQHTSIRPKGPIRLLTHLRYFGYCINPVSFYYCFDAAGEQVETMVAEITNTPWGERFSYVLTSGLDHGRPPHHHYDFAKTFHVSPFFPMDLEYDWRFLKPGQRITVHMNLSRADSKVFDASLNLHRLEITPKNLALCLFKFPFMTLKVAFGIYFQAALLKLKNIPFYDHP